MGPIIDAQIFQKSGNHLKIQGTRRVTWNVFHNEHPQLLGATEHNLVAGWPGTRDSCITGAHTQFSK
jgi:hypothetical protein